MKDIRRIGLLLIATFMMLPAMAQVSFGVRAGGAYSSLIQKVNDKYQAKSRFGFSVAGMADIPLSKDKKWSLRPELGFVHQGGSFYMNPKTQGTTTLADAWYYSIQVPVNVAYTFNFTDVSLSIFAGPVFDWSLFGKIKTGENAERDIKFGVSEGKDLKPCTFGMDLGIAVDYYNFFFSVNSLCGMVDRQAKKLKGETSVFQNNVTFSLGYFFRSK